MDNKKSISCDVCKGAIAFTHCLECNIAICKECAYSEVKRSGLGCVWALHYCVSCTPCKASATHADFADVGIEIKKTLIDQEK